MIRRTPLPALLSLLAAVLIFGSGCEERKGVRIGDTAPAVTGLDLQANPVGPATLKGKTVVLYFWTDSCCGDSLKLLEPFYSRNKSRGLELVAINEVDPKDVVRSYATRNKLSFVMLCDEHSLLFKEYNVVGFPTVLILDRTGVVREKVLGDMRTEKLEKLILTHLN